MPAFSKRKEKTMPFGVNLMRSQKLYRVAQACNLLAQLQCCLECNVHMYGQQHNGHDLYASAHMQGTGE